MQLVQSHGSGLATLSGPHAIQIQQTFEALRQYHSSGVNAGTITADQIRIAYLLGNPTLSAYVLAISIGSVFFGACTYIGNGPNLMVKAIADHQKVHTPRFLGYILHHTLPFMIPTLLIVWWIFFRS